MDLPAFYEFFVDDQFIDFFDKKFEIYKQKFFLIEKNSSATYNGVQTPNILNLNENDVYEILNYFKEKIEKKCGCKFKYHWVHLIEYEYGGYQLEHSHDHNEDFSIIVYLNNCDDGETYFYLNKKKNVIEKIFPRKGKSIMFLSSILHGANKTTKNKKVLVLGINYDKSPGL